MAHAHIDVFNAKVRCTVQRLSNGRVEISLVVVDDFELRMDADEAETIVEELADAVNRAKDIMEGLRDAREPELRQS